MATYFGQIDTYTVNILSPIAYNGRRVMDLIGSFGKTVLWFYPDDTTSPDNQKRSGQEIFDIYYNVRDWQAIIDVLRHESPVYFNYSDSHNAAQMYTGREPVGEEETT